MGVHVLPGGGAVLETQGSCPTPALLLLPPHTGGSTWATCSPPRHRNPSPLPLLCVPFPTLQPSLPSWTRHLLAGSALCPWEQTRVGAGEALGQVSRLAGPQLSTQAAPWSAQFLIPSLLPRRSWLRDSPTGEGKCSGSVCCRLAVLSTTACLTPPWGPDTAAQARGAH